MQWSVQSQQVLVYVLKGARIMMTAEENNCAVSMGVDMTALMESNPEEFLPSDSILMCAFNLGQLSKNRA